MARDGSAFVDVRCRRGRQFAFPATRILWGRAPGSRSDRRVQNSADAIRRMAKQGSSSLAVAETEGLKPEHVYPYAGSSDPLLRTVCLHFAR